MHAALALAEYAAGVRGSALSQLVRGKVAQCVLDVLTAAVAGYNVPPVRALRGVVQSLYGSGAAAVWFSGITLAPAGAVFCNSAAASYAPTHWSSVRSHYSIIICRQIQLH